jgi:tight adherence protein B
MSSSLDTFLGFLLVCSLFALSFGALAYALFAAMQEAMESYSAVYAEDTARQFEDVFLFIQPAQLTRIAYIAAAAVFMLCMVVLGDFSSPGGMATGFFFGLAGGLGALQGPRLILGHLKRRRLEKFNQQLEDALARMSNSLKAGFSILQAFESIVKEGQNPIAQEFGMFLHQLRVGVRFEDALAQMEKRVGSEDLTLTVRAIEVARLTGGNLTDVLGKIAETIRERRRIQGKIDAMTAQGRLQGIVVGAIPVLLLVVLAFMDPKMITSFVTSVPGIACLVVVVILEVAGAVVIRKITRIEI